MIEPLYSGVIDEERVGVVDPAAEPGDGLRRLGTSS